MRFEITTYRSGELYTLCLFENKGDQLLLTVTDTDPQTAVGEVLDDLYDRLMAPFLEAK